MTTSLGSSAEPFDELAAGVDAGELLPQGGFVLGPGVEEAGAGHEVGARPGVGAQRGVGSGTRSGLGARTVQVVIGEHAAGRKGCRGLLFGCCGHRVTVLVRIVTGGSLFVCGCVQMSWGT